MHELSEGKLPFSLDDVCLKVCDRGCVVEIPLDKDEQLYGFGLQYGTFGQRGLRKRPIVNDNPLNDLGYTHAPQPFYVIQHAIQHFFVDQINRLVKMYVQQKEIEIK